MDTDSEYDYSSQSIASDASMDDGDDDDYFDNTADAFAQHRKVGSRAPPVQMACCGRPPQNDQPTAVLVPLQTKYLVLTKEDIKKRQQEVVDSVTSVLGISSEDAERILRKYKWCA